MPGRPDPSWRAAPLAQSIPIAARVATSSGTCRAAALLATELAADALVLVTGVDSVLLDFGKPSQRELTVVAADEMRMHALAGQFPAGSMGPKVEAALDFVDAGGDVAVITSANLMSASLDSLSGPGTHIVRSIG